MEWKSLIAWAVTMVLVWVLDLSLPQGSEAEQFLWLTIYLVLPIAAALFVAHSDGTIPSVKGTRPLPEGDPLYEPVKSLYTVILVLAVVLVFVLLIHIVSAWF